MVILQILKLFQRDQATYEEASQEEKSDEEANLYDKEDGPSGRAFETFVLVFIFKHDPNHIY